MAILDLADLSPGSPAAELEESVAAYRSGNLPQAAKYPEQRTPASGPERVYLASLLLVVGSVAKAEALLEPLSEDPQLQRLAAAHRQLIGAVLRQECGTTVGHPQLLATERMAASYCLQSQGKLEEALNAARLDGGGARVRVWVGPACRVGVQLWKEPRGDGDGGAGAALTPENAEAWALQGFCRRRATGSARP